MMKILLVFIFISCSLNSKKDITLDLNDLSGYSDLNQEDISQHLESYKDFYLANDVKLVSLDLNSRKYLEDLARNIITKNELFFKQKKQASFYIVKEKIPFHFSLPNNKIFLSSALIKRYIKDENILNSVIAYELIRSEKLIYEKNIIIPTGYMSTEKILSLMRLDIKTKLELHKWTFYILKRIGIDKDIYLSWLQIKNRNSLDFSLQLGDIQAISKEEALFKSFMVKNSSFRSTQGKYIRSSKAFYRFMRDVKRKS